MKINIRELRKNNGLTMKEVAKRVGVSEATISRWESGQIANMKRDKIALLADTLHINPSDILGIDEYRQGYYTDPEVAEYANKLKNNPDMRLLFDAAEDMSKDDIDFVVNMIDKLKQREGK
ncbi:helix-turn-helix domain-containing protein [Veillonella montpellierensis]|uniref:helix-turn-helix domain-containing protein n=1 Tax=Veillonella montpellierensis TaxID=187328 RepID=UPI0023F938B6|nr:helix-turn-helix transcriptional regulator [Veillonella montpellierensis]